MDYFILNTERVTIIQTRNNVMANERCHALLLFDNKRRPSALLTQRIINDCRQIGRSSKKTRVKLSQIRCLGNVHVTFNRPPHHLFTNSRAAEKWRRNNCSDRQYISRRANVIDKERVAYRDPLFLFISNRVHTHTFIVNVLSLLSASLAVYIQYCLFLNPISPHTTLTSYNLTLLPIWNDYV